ncbi:MAG: nitrogenase-stabilizing/protective protein NifW [Rhodocyclaceae bacterium]|nr:nitrogenase-stabilizing/protective protein NifW [Rhodocyclaceae bacterium]
MIDDITLDDALEELESAEDFLNHFGVPFDASVVHVSRLHILQRYHDYLGREGEPEGTDAERFAGYKALLERAYHDFVESTPLEEKVFKVFRMHEPQVAFVPVESLRIR